MFQKVNKTRVFLVLLILAALSLCLETYFGLTNASERKISKSEESIRELTDIHDNSIDDLRAKYHNDDIIGIINVEDTSINEPVVQTIDNDYYLTHNLNHEYDQYGSIYMDYRIDLNHSKRIIVFGHSSSKYDKEVVPFQELENYYDENYYQEHKSITLTLDTEIRYYEVFSVYVETSDFTYMNLNFDSEEDWYWHILGLQKKSLYPIDIDLDIDDEILIMQTCSNKVDYQSYSKKYLLVVSRRVK